MIGPLVDLANKNQVDPDKIKLEVAIYSLTQNFHAQYPQCPIAGAYFLRDGNVLGALIFPVQCHEAEPYSGAHAVVIIRIESTTIPVVGRGQISTRQLVIKNSSNAEQIIRIPEVYNTDEFNRNPIAFKAKFTAFTEDDFLISPAGWNLQFKTI